MTDVSTKRAMSKEMLLLIAAVGAAVIGVLFYNVMPLYLGSMQDSLHLTASQIGFVASAFFLGFNLASASSYFWVRKLPIRSTVTACVLVMAALLGLSAFVVNYVGILALSSLVGAASGAVASIAATLVGDAKNAARWFGVKVAAESFGGVVLLFVLPVALVPALGFKGTIIGMLVLIGLLFPLLAFLGKSPIGESVNEATGLSDGAARRFSSGDAISGGVAGLPSLVALLWSRRAVWFGIFAMLLFFVGGSGVWAFEERIATNYGFDPAWVGGVLGISLIFAVIGPLVSGAVGQKFGNRVPFVIACIFTVMGILALAGSNQVAFYYALGACGFMLGWGGGMPFIYSKVAMEDPDGRHLALTIPAIGIGSMLGPAITGMFYGDGSIVVLQWMSVITVALAAVLIWFAHTQASPVAARA